MRTRRERGGAMVLVLVLMVGLAVISATAMWLGSNRLRQTANLNARAQAMAAAQAGVAYARWALTMQALGTSLSGNSAQNATDSTNACKSLSWNDANTSHATDEYLTNDVLLSSELGEGGMVDATNDTISGWTPRLNTDNRGKILWYAGAPVCNIPLVVRDAMGTALCDSDGSTNGSLARCAEYTVWVRPGNRDIKLYDPYAGSTENASPVKDAMILIDVTGVASDRKTTVRLLVGGDYSQTTLVSSNAVMNSGEYAQEGLNMGNTNASFSGAVSSATATAYSINN